MALFTSDADRAYYRSVLERASRGRCSIHAYVLMTNHVHLLVTPVKEGSAARMMQSVGRRYVAYFNFLQQRTGTMWEGRYRSSLIASENHLLACSRYIELNPVRAGMVDAPESFPWSSYRCNALGDADALVTPHAVFLALGPGQSERRQVYKALFAELLEPEVVNAIRIAIGARAVGGPWRRRRALGELPPYDTDPTTLTLRSDSPTDQLT